MNKKSVKKIVVTTLVASLSMSNIFYGNVSPMVFAEQGQGLTKKVDGMVIEDGVLKKYEGDAANIVIPEGVVTIGEYAFEYKECIKSVTLPKSVTKIGQYAFFKCKNLEKVDNNGDIDSIGDVAFSGCEKLSSIDLSMVKHIGNAAFVNCKSLKVLKLDAIQNLDGFSGAGIEEVELNFIGEDSSIEHSAFEECENLKEVIIKGDLSKIGNEAFLRCKALKNIQIENEDKVTHIGDRVFEQTPWLKEQLEKSENKMLIINDILVKYQPNVFYAGEYDGTSNGEFSTSKEEMQKHDITDESFTYTAPSNVKMETVTIPSTVKAIAGYAFFGAYSVEKVIFDSKIKSLEIGEAAFDFTTWELEYLEKENFLVIGGNLIKANCNAETIEVPNGVTKILLDAFMINGLTGKTPDKEMVKVKEIILPQSVKEVCDLKIHFYWELDKIIYPTALKKELVLPGHPVPSEYVFKDMDTTKDAKDLLEGYQLEETSKPVTTATTKPSATPEPTPTAKVTPTPTAKVTPTPTAKVTPTPTAKVTPTPTAKVTPTPTAKVTPTPTAKVTPTPTAKVTPTPMVLPTSEVVPTVMPTNVVATVTPPKKTEKPTSTQPATSPIVKPKVKKALILKWKNVSARKIKVTVKKSEKVKGYQCLISKNKSFKKQLRKINSKKNVIVIGNLKKKTTYYLKVRAYKLDAKGKKVYGKYSNVKKIKR